MIGNNPERNPGQEEELEMSPEVGSEGALEHMAVVLSKEIGTDQDLEAVRQRLIELGVLAEGTPISISEQRKPYLGQ